MKYSLVSREVIADYIEVAVNGQCMDGVVAVGGSDAAAIVRARCPWLTQTMLTGMSHIIKK
jgi:hypothetical protein